MRVFSRSVETRHFLSVGRNTYTMASQTPTKHVVLGSGRLLGIQRKIDAVELLGWLAVLIPVLSYLADGGLTNLTDASRWFEVINRLSALIGTSMLLVHMLLIARIPWLEKTLGLDKLTAHHKRLGKPVLYLLVLHSLTAVVSYSIADSVNPLTTLIDLITDYPQLLLATVGLVLMIVVVISSIRAARRRLSYETWYLIHLVSYVAVLVAIPHQFELGSELLSSPWLNGYFIALYLYVFANVAWFRSLHPVVASLVMNQRIAQVKKEANRTTSLTITGRRIERLGVEAGQFFMLRVMAKGMWWRPHPFSVSASPSKEIRFTIGARGDDTAKIQDLKPGTRVILEGPFGVFSEAKRTKQHVTLIAAGIGIAPIRALAESMAAEPGDITVIYRVTDTSDAALLDEVKRICQEREHYLFILTGSRPNGPGFMPVQLAGERQQPEFERLLTIAPYLLESDVYICGPAPWSESVLHALGKLRVPNDYIHLEEFSW